jgi:hypothetical protein
MQNTERLTRRRPMQGRQPINHDEREQRELAREWSDDPSARWLIALDAAIRRAARAVAGFFGHH